MRLAIYARVSTRDQNLEPQLDALRAYAERRGASDVQVFADHGVSGAKSRRPGLDALLTGCRRREVDVVAAVRLDRLARSVRHACELAAELDALRVDLVLTEQAIDSATPTGRFLFHALAAVAELERSLIEERAQAGREAARRRGVRFGRPRGTTPAQEARGRRLRASGRSIRQIAEALGLPTTTAHRMLGRRGV